MASIKRVGGGLQEVLALPGKDVLTTRDVAFILKDEAAVALVLDGTNRFEAADTATQALVDAETDRREAEAAAKQAAEDAAAVSEPTDGA